jgi:hypothetical protein
VEFLINLLLRYRINPYFELLLTSCSGETSTAAESAGLHCMACVDSVGRDPAQRATDYDAISVNRCDNAEAAQQNSTSANPANTQIFVPQPSPMRTMKTTPAMSAAPSRSILVYMTISSATLEPDASPKTAQEASQSTTLDTITSDAMTSSLSPVPVFFPKSPDVSTLWIQ